MYHRLFSPPFISDVNDQRKRSPSHRDELEAVIDVAIVRAEPAGFGEIEIMEIAQ